MIYKKFIGQLTEFGREYQWIWIMALTRAVLDRAPVRLRRNSPLVRMNQTPVCLGKRGGQGVRLFEIYDSLRDEGSRQAQDAQSRLQPTTSSFKQSSTTRRNVSVNYL